MAKTLILVGVDFSPFGEAAFDAAIKLAKDLNAGLLLVHAFQRGFIEPDEPSLMAASIPDLEGVEEENDAVEMSTEWASRARGQGVQVQVETARGPPAGVIADAAKRHDAAMIVIGTHGRSGLSRLVLGSVAEAIVRHADRPVLVVPMPKK